MGSPRTTPATRPRRSSSGSHRTASPGARGHHCIDPSRAILRVALEDDAALIAAGTTAAPSSRNLARITRTVLGATAARLVRHSPAPSWPPNPEPRRGAGLSEHRVRSDPFERRGIDATKDQGPWYPAVAVATLLWPARATVAQRCSDRGMDMTKTVLVPLDGSTVAEGRPSTAVWLAGVLDCELHLLSTNVGPGTLDQQAYLDRCRSDLAIDDAVLHVVGHRFAAPGIIDTVRALPDPMVCMDHERSERLAGDAARHRDRRGPPQGRRPRRAHRPAMHHDADQGPRTGAGEHRRVRRVRSRRCPPSPSWPPTWDSRSMW